MSKNIYTKEKIRPLHKKKEKVGISPHIIKSIFNFQDFNFQDINFQDIRNYRDSFKEDIYKKYLKICKDFGFEESVHKNEKTLREEYQCYIQKTSTSLFQNKNKIKKLKLPEYIKLVDSKEIKSDCLPEFEKIYKIYKEVSVKEDFILFCEIFKNIKFNIKDTRNEKDETLIIIENIFKYKVKWINSLENFKLKTKNKNKALKNLLEHLFCKYPINMIFLELMFKQKESIIFIEIAEGKSPKKVIEEYLPDYDLTKKMIHSLNKERTNLSFNKRIRQLQLTGYQNKIIQEVLNSFKGEDFVEDESLFKEYLIHLNNQDLAMFEQNQIMPVFDYIKYLKNIYIQRESLFRMKDHSLEKLYEGMIQWHKELGRTKHDYTWEATDIPTYHKITENEDNKQTKEVIIKELTSSNELRKEGKEMRHCVASYASSCKRGVCSIFSLKVKEFNVDNLKGKATIEVRNNKTVQIRAKSNLSVSKSDINYINDWKRKNKIG